GVKPMAILGFRLDFWDYATFAAIAVIVFAALGLAVFVLGLPGRIAIARNHPEADAVNLMGWVGFVAIVPWIQALIWAFKPTDVIDIRNLPEAERRETQEVIARLKGKVRGQQPCSSPSRRSSWMTNRHDDRNPGPDFRLGDLLAHLLQVQMDPAQPRLGPDFRLLRHPPDAGVSDWPALRDAELRQRHDRTAHHPAHSAADPTGGRHRGHGPGQRPGEKGPAALPVRPPSVRGPGGAARGAARSGKAERQRHESRRGHRDAQGCADVGSADLRTI